MIRRIILQILVLITITRGIHIKHTWNGKGALALAAIGEKVSSKIYSVTIYSAIPITQIALDAANKRVRDAYGNRVADSVELDNAEKALVDILDEITVFADPIAAGDVAKIQSAGFDATAGTRNPKSVPVRGITPKAVATAGGNVDLSVEKTAGATHYMWVIFTSTVFAITVEGGHIVLPPSNPGCIIIPEGNIRESLHGFAPRLQMYAGVIPVNSEGLGAMSVIVDFSTI
jgi:hypothetical protein